MPPMALMVLPFDGTLLWMLVYFLGAIEARGEVFKEGFGLERRDTSSVDSISQ